MVVKSIEGIVKSSGVSRDEELKLREALHQLDTNNDNNLDTSEVADAGGYLACNSVTEKWWYYNLNPVQNALFRSNLVEHLRGAICPRTYDIPKNTSTGREWMPDRADAIEVVQREFAITKPDSDQTEFLQTFGAGPCVVLTLYDPATKTGVMAHIDALTNLPQSFGMITSDLQTLGVDISKMEARLVGGDSSSRETVSNIYKQITDRGIKVIEIDVVRDTPAAVMMDTKTGKLYDYSEEIHTTPQKKLEALGFEVVMPGSLRRSKFVVGSSPKK